MWYPQYLDRALFAHNHFDIPMSVLAFWIFRSGSKLELPLVHLGSDFIHNPAHDMRALTNAR